MEVSNRLADGEAEQASEFMGLKFGREARIRDEHLEVMRIRLVFKNMRLPNDKKCRMNKEKREG